MERPRVTITTPSFQQGKFLEEAIRSVMAQDYPNLEHLAIDGGSTDGSVAILRRYGNRLAAWISEPEQGQTDALNKGFARAQPEILGRLNADDVYRPGAMAGAVDYLQAHPEVGVVYGDLAPLMASRSAWSELGQYRRWSQFWDARDRQIRELRSRGDSEVQVVFIDKIIPDVAELQPDPDYWYNNCAEWFYDLDRLSANLPGWDS